MTSSKAPLTVLFSIFAFAFPLLSVLAHNGVVALLLVTAVLAGLIVWRAERRLPRPDLPLSTAFATLLAWCGIASLWSLDVPHALGLSARIGAIFAAGLFLFAVVAEQNDETRRTVGKWLLIGFLTSFVIVIAEILFDYPLIRLIYDTGPTRSHWRVRLNHGATALALLTWPAIALLWHAGWRKSALLLPFMLAAILSFLDSSASILGLVVGGLCLLLAISHRKAGRIVLVIATLAVFLGAPLAGKLMYAQGLHEADWLFKSARQRVDIWNFSVDRFLEKPILGWGFDASRNIEELYDGNRQAGQKMMPLHPHQAVLQILVELGVVGGFVSLVLLWLLAARIEGLPPPYRICGQAFYAAALANALVSFGLWQNQWLSMLISAALLLALTARPGVPIAGR